MTARYSILAVDRHGWIPSTLELSAGSCGALAFGVISLRGRGTVLARGEFAGERWGSACGFPATVPDGYEVIALDTARGEYRFVSVAAKEIMAAIQRMRRGKQSGAPQGKTVTDEIWTCVSCGWRSMSRGGDTAGWKGVQVSPGDIDFVYFCNKAACQPALGRAIERAKVNWGYSEAAETEPGEGLPMPMVTNKR